MRKRLSKTCLELLLGIVVIMTPISIIGVTLCIAFKSHWLSFLLGVLLGSVFAGTLACHMDVTIQKAIKLKPDQAEKYTKRCTFFRFIIMAVVLFIALTFPKFFDLLGVLLGMMALKFSAYLQPLISKYITNK